MGKISATLKKLRNEKNLTAREVASRIQIPESTYRAWEAGRVIQGEPYPKLAQVFGVSLDELFGLIKPKALDALLSIKAIEGELEKIKNILSRS